MSLLEEQTKQYWLVSQVYEGRIKKRITTEKALNILTEVIDLTAYSPGRRNLMRSADRLRQTIITPPVVSSAELAALMPNNV